mgnify:FL=1
MIIKMIEENKTCNKLNFLNIFYTPLSIEIMKSSSYRVSNNENDNTVDNLYNILNIMLNTDIEDTIYETLLEKIRLYNSDVEIDKHITKDDETSVDYSFMINNIKISLSLIYRTINQIDPKYQKNIYQNFVYLTQGKITYNEKTYSFGNLINTIFYNTTVDNKNITWKSMVVSNRSLFYMIKDIIRNNNIEFSNTDEHELSNKLRPFFETINNMISKIFDLDDIIFKSNRKNRKTDMKQEIEVTIYPNGSSVDSLRPVKDMVKLEYNLLGIKYSERSDSMYIFRNENDKTDINILDYFKKYGRIRYVTFHIRKTV